MVRKKKKHSGLQEEECLNSTEKNVDERFEKEINPRWTIMYSLHEETPVTKEWSNEKKEKLKIQGETL